MFLLVNIDIQRVMTMKQELELKLQEEFPLSRYNNPNPVCNSDSDKEFSK